MTELDLLRRVEVEIRALREVAGCDASKELNEALEALDEWRTTHGPPPVMCSKCKYPEVAHGRNVYACSWFTP